MSNSSNHVKRKYPQVGSGWHMVHNLCDEEAAQLLQEISAEATPESPDK